MQVQYQPLQNKVIDLERKLAVLAQWAWSRDGWNAAPGEVLKLGWSRSNGAVFKMMIRHKIFIGSSTNPEFVTVFRMGYQGTPIHYNVKISDHRFEEDATRHAVILALIDKFENLQKGAGLQHMEPALMM